MKRNAEFYEVQMKLCLKYQVEYFSAPIDLKVGISRNVRDGVLPINGLRHPPEGTTTGWYIYAGEEFSENPDFFVPLHVEHIKDWCPQIIKFLGLPPDWRFYLFEQ